jgi:hypothetical protein
MFKKSILQKFKTSRKSNIYDLWNMPASCGGQRVAAVTGAVFLPGEASSSCSKLDVQTREQKEFGAGPTVALHVSFY